jgi:uncharacterized membrane protein YphA (DoxX/SURF4 family)
MEILALLGRVLFSVMFVASGVNHITKRHYMSEYAKSMGAPSPSLMVPLTGIAIIAGGLMVALGIFGDAGALVIAGFLLATAFWMHPFWKMEGEMAQMQQIQFMKNVTMAGGALAIAALFMCTTGLSLTGALFH